MSTAFNSAVISVITITIESFLCINMELLTRSCPHPKPHLLVYRRDERKAHKWGLHGVRVLSYSIHIWSRTNWDTTNSTYTLAWKRFASHTSRPACCPRHDRPYQPSHPPRAHIWNPQYRPRLIQVLSVRPRQNGVCQQHAVRSCQILLWCPSRFCPGACPFHPI